MAWRYHGRARVNPRNPQAFGVCDDCGIWYNLVDLQYQVEWRGNALVATGFRKCQRCLDVPNEQLRPRILPPDPVPVDQPRPEPFALDNQGGGMFLPNLPPAPTPPPPPPPPHDVGQVTQMRPWGFAGSAIQIPLE